MNKTYNLFLIDLIVNHLINLWKKYVKGICRAQHFINTLLFTVHECFFFTWIMLFLGLNSYFSFMGWQGKNTLMSSTIFAFVTVRILDSSFLLDYMFLKLETMSYSSLQTPYCLKYSTASFNIW